MNSSLRIAALVVSVVATASVVTSCKEKGGAEGFAASVKKAIGPEVRDYQALGYPTGNFGVGTAYMAPASGTEVSDKDFLCATWRCLAADGNNPPADAGDQLKVRVRGTSYADVGTGSTISLTSDESNEYAFKFALPKIKQVLNLGFGLDSKSVTKVELKFGAASKRLLAKPDFVAYLNDAAITSPAKAALTKAFAQGALVLVVGDVVFESLSATITTSSELKPEIEAKLGGLPSVVFSDAEASFKLTKTADSTYKVESTGPVVALRLLKAQPGAGLLGDDANWDSWSAATGPVNPKSN